MLAYLNQIEFCCITISSSVSFLNLRNVSPFNEVKGSYWETSSLSHCFFFFCNIIPIITLTLFYLLTDQLDIPDSNSVAMWTGFVWLTDHPAGISLTTTTPVTHNNSTQQHIGQDIKTEM